jgi:hypothetical protein
MGVCMKNEGREDKQVNEILGTTILKKIFDKALVDTKPLLSYSIQVLSRQMLSELKIKEEAEMQLGGGYDLTDESLFRLKENLRYALKRIPDYKQAIDLLIEEERRNALKNINPASYGMPRRKG